MMVKGTLPTLHIIRQSLKKGACAATQIHHDWLTSPFERLCMESWMAHTPPQQRAGFILSRVPSRFVSTLLQLLEKWAAYEHGMAFPILQLYRSQCTEMYPIMSAVSLLDSSRMSTVTKRLADIQGKIQSTETFFKNVMFRCRHLVLTSQTSLRKELTEHLKVAFRFWGSQMLCSFN